MTTEHLFIHEFCMLRYLKNYENQMSLIIKLKKCLGIFNIIYENYRLVTQKTKQTFFICLLAIKSLI